jgi:hypothetical protein
MDKQMKKRSLAALIAAPVVLVGIAGGTALAASSPATAAPSNVYGCVSGASRTLDGVYTVPANFKACKDGFPFTVASGAKGATGPQGPAGTPTLYESTGNSTPDLAIDMAPGPNGSAGSGGWGWDSTTHKPVTDLTVGTAATLTVTVIQPGTETADGSITLTYDPFDFTLTTSPTEDTCALIADTQQETCSFTDLAHSSVSKAFVFTPAHPDPDATIGATATVNGEEATAQFPVQITK